MNDEAKAASRPRYEGVGAVTAIGMIRALLLQIEVHSVAANLWHSPNPSANP
jgi:hypothetical protein